MYICVYIEGYTVRLHCEYAQGGARPGSSAYTLPYTSLPVYTRDAKTPAPATAQRVYTRTTDNTDNTRVYTHTPGWQENKHRHTPPTEHINGPPATDTDNTPMHSASADSAGQRGTFHRTQRYTQRSMHSATQHSTLHTAVHTHNTLYHTALYTQRSHSTL